MVGIQRYIIKNVLWHIFELAHFKPLALLPKKGKIDTKYLYIKHVSSVNLILNFQTNLLNSCSSQLQGQEPEILAAVYFLVSLDCKIEKLEVDV